MRFLAILCLALAFVTSAVAQESPYFEVDTLNEGLGPAPDGVDLSTPQSAIEAFLDAADAGNFERAAHVLNLGKTDVENQMQDGPILARMLDELLERKVVIDWGQLLDRPDGLDETATSDSAVAGKSRRSLLLEKITLDDRVVAVRLNRFKPNDADAVWMFSPQTVGNIRRLHALYGPSRLERMLPEILLVDAVAGLKLWEIIALPIVITLALLGGLSVHSVMSDKENDQRRRWHRALLRAVRPPLSIFVTTSVLTFFTSTLFTFSGPVDQLLSPLTVLGYVVAALLLIMNILDAILDRIVARDVEALSEIDASDSRDLATKVSALRRAAIVLISLIGGGVVLSSAGVFDSLGYSLLASAGAVTLILGFAARNVLGNIMASMQIALNRSAKIGDKIVYRGEICNVERINFTYVQLRVWTGTRMVVPVEDFVAQPFENWTMMDHKIIRTIILKLAHNADIEKMRAKFFEIVKGLDQEQLGDLDDAKVMVDDQDVFGIDVMFCLPCANPNTAWEISCETREALVKAGRDMTTDDRPTFPDTQAAQAVT